jgi:hypothetical protein
MPPLPLPRTPLFRFVSFCQQIDYTLHVFVLSIRRTPSLLLQESNPRSFLLRPEYCWARGTSCSRDRPVCSPQLCILYPSVYLSCISYDFSTVCRHQPCIFWLSCVSSDLYLWPCGVISLDLFVLSYANKECIKFCCVSSDLSLYTCAVLLGWTLSSHRSVYPVISLCIPHLYIHHSSLYTSAVYTPNLRGSIYTVVLIPEVIYLERWPTHGFCLGSWKGFVISITTSDGVHSLLYGAPLEHWCILPVNRLAGKEILKEQNIKIRTVSALWYICTYITS